jgi:hypothetical protein
MKKITFLAISLFLFNYVSAQKSAPIAGDAAILIDLLKKDYSSSNPDTKLEEINTDREKVIVIFKSYLKDSISVDLVVDHTIIIELQKCNLIYANNLNAFNTLFKNNFNFGSEYKIETAEKTINSIQGKLLDSKIVFFKQKYEFDISYLKKIKTLYSENPYLEKVTELFIKKYEKLNSNQIDYFAQYNYQSSIQKSLPFIGGDLAFETIIDGLSRFLAKRIKEELTLHAIDKIKKYLHDPKPENYSQELMVILPKTTNYLKRFNANQLLNFTNELKQLIEEDLNAILENAKGLRDLPKIQSYIAKQPDLEFAFDGLEILPQLSKIKNPVDYFELLENSRALSNWRNETTNIDKYNIAQGLRLASMLAYSLTVVENGEQKFVSIDFLSNYGSETNFYFLYFGFLHQQNLKYFDIKFKKANDAKYYPFDVKKVMESITVEKIENGKADFNFIKESLTNVAQYAEKIHTTTQSIKKKNKNGEELNYEEIHGFVSEIIGFTEEIVATSDLLLKNDYKLEIISDELSESIDFKTKLIPYFSVARIGNDLVLDLHQKKYSNAIVKAIEIPLYLNLKKQGVKNNLYSAKILIENQNDLMTLSKALNPSIKIEEVKSLKSNLTIVNLRLKNIKGLENTEKSLDTFLKSIDDNNLTLDNYKINLIPLKTTLEQDRDKLLAHFGIDKAKINSKIVTYLEDKGQSKAIQEHIKTKLDSYYNALYQSEILHEADTSLQLESELKDLFLAFAPDYIENNDVLKDTQALKIIHFINDISLSSTPEDVEKAIDAFALPVGSSSLKEGAKCYYSINAFPGIVGGFEFSEDQDRAITIGFTAPVGLYLQPWGSLKCGGTFGIFIPIIDIAAPVRLRLDDDSETETLPDFNFYDIFSPGIYGVYGFKNSPFTINLGAQYGPKLRDIPDGNNGFTSVDSYRINLGVTIDIPLLTLFGKYKD